MRLKPVLVAVALSSAGSFRVAVAAEPARPVPAATTADSSGEALYRHWCAGCHDPGPGHPGTLRMAGDLGSENAVLREMKSLNRALVQLAVRRGFQMMPPFRPTEISNEELRRIADYLVGGKP